MSFLEKVANTARKNVNSYLNKQAHRETLKQQVESESNALKAKKEYFEQKGKVIKNIQDTSNPNINLTLVASPENKFSVIHNNPIQTKIQEMLGIVKEKLDSGSIVDSLQIQIQALADSKMNTGELHAVLAPFINNPVKIGKITDALISHCDFSNPFFVKPRTQTQINHIKPRPEPAPYISQKQLNHQTEMEHLDGILKSQRNTAIIAASLIPISIVANKAIEASFTKPNEIHNPIEQVIENRHQHENKEPIINDHNKERKINRSVIESQNQTADQHTSDKITQSDSNLHTEQKESTQHHK